MIYATAAVGKEFCEEYSKIINKEGTLNSITYLLTILNFLVIVKYFYIKEKYGVMLKKLFFYLLYKKSIF